MSAVTSNRSKALTDVMHFFVNFGGGGVNLVLMKTNALYMGNDITVVSLSFLNSREVALKKQDELCFFVFFKSTKSANRK